MFLYCFRFGGATVPRPAVCAWVNRIDHRIYLARRSGAALRHHRIWRLADRHLYHAGVTLYDRWYLQPFFLLTGAVWYNLLTLCGHLIFPIRPLQDNLARSYEQLAHYLDLKSRLFDPDIEDESQAPLYDLAIANGQLVTTLNQTKVSLLTRLRGDRGQRGTRRTLQYYFVAQDIHERASSSHIQYQTLRDHFRYSDVMFRFQRMLSMQAQACQKLSRAILLREPYQHDAHFERAFMHLDAALDRVQASGAPAEQMKALGFLLNNLRAIDAQLATIESAQTSAPANSATENLLADDGLNSFSDIWLRRAATCRQNRLCSVMRSGCHWSSVPAMRLSSSPA